MSSSFSASVPRNALMSCHANTPFVLQLDRLVRHCADLLTILLENHQSWDRVVNYSDFPNAGPASEHLAVGAVRGQAQEDKNISWLCARPCAQNCKPELKLCLWLSLVMLVCPAVPGRKIFSFNDAGLPRSA
eukprot:scaffold101021_cov16-Tisochrysis_lutea.AAC.2